MSSSDKTLPFVINYLPEEFLQVAQKELNETTEEKVHLLRELKSMIRGDETLDDIDFHPDFLLQYLRVSKFKSDAAFRRLQKYVNVRRKYPNYISGVQDKISTDSAYKWMSPLPYRSPEGCAILLLKYGMWHPNDIPYEHVQRMCHLLLHCALRNPINQIVGFKLILDCKGMTIHHLKYGTPTKMYQQAQMYLECIPARFKQFHCVNCTVPMKLAWTVLSPFLPQKIKSRVMFHNDPEDLLEYFPKHILPTEYGGELEDYYMHEWMKEANYQMDLSTPSGQPNIF